MTENEQEYKKAEEGETDASAVQMQNEEDNAPGEAGAEETVQAADGCESAENPAACENPGNFRAEEGEEKECRGGKGRLKKELAGAREEAEKWKAEAEETKRKWYAVTAEYENYRRRTQNQTAQKYAEGRSDVIASLFPIGDNLERAMAACTDDNTRQGLEMVLKSYKKVLEGEKVEEIDPTGQPFDAAIAEAIMAMPAAEGEEAGIVKQVYVKGYKRGDKVLRYAQVIVTQ